LQLQYNLEVFIDLQFKVLARHKNSPGSAGTSHYNGMAPNAKVAFFDLQDG
jgi:hypothetical protein